MSFLVTLWFVAPNQHVRLCLIRLAVVFISFLINDDYCCVVSCYLTRCLCECLYLLMLRSIKFLAVYLSGLAKLCILIAFLATKMYICIVYKIQGKLCYLNQLQRRMVRPIIHGPLIDQFEFYSVINQVLLQGLYYQCAVSFILRFKTLDATLWQSVFLVVLWSS